MMIRSFFHAMALVPLTAASRKRMPRSPRGRPTGAASTWTSRPFLFGLLCFALTLLVAEGGLDPRWLVPIGWFWVNTHGSFPMGFVLLTLHFAMRFVIGPRARERTA